jgi:hypothetical protein
MRRYRFLQVVFLAFVIVGGGARAAVPPVVRQAAAVADRVVLAKPERLGFSSESLRNLDTAMQGIVDKKHLAGIVTLLARHGQVVQHKAYGLQDIDSQTPMPARYHHAHLLDDQANYRRGDDDAVRRR